MEKSAQNLTDIESPTAHEQTPPPPRPAAHRKEQQRLQHHSPAGYGAGSSTGMSAPYL